MRDQSVQARQKRAEQKAKEPTDPAREFGLLFELEYVSTKGRQRQYKALKAALEQRDIPLAPCTYSRYCLHDSVEKFLPHLSKAAGKQRASCQKLSDEIRVAVRKSFSDGDVHIDEGLAVILKAAEKMNLAVGVVTSLDRDTADGLMAKLKLADRGIGLVCVSDCEHGFPAPDAWLRLALHLGISPKRCVTLASSSMSCRAALAAGMRCAAVPDDFTAFEDFSGTDYIVERQTESLLRDLLALLK